jgi:diguanylate cyclase (GGDEF)-like protein
MGSEQPPGGNGSRPPTLVRHGNPGASGDAAPGRPRWEEADVDAFSEQTASGQPTMSAALRKMDTLLKLNRALREEINLLVSALAKADHSALFDESTGLPNGRLLQNHFDLAKSRADRKHSQVGLICLSLYGLRFGAGLIDNFAVDGVLQQAADRLVSCTRSYDSACRYGHDGFVILLPHLEDREQAIAAQRRITIRLAAPYKVEGTAVSVEARSGVAMYPPDGRDYAETLKVADYDKRSCGGAYTSLARQGAAASAFRRREWT